jgi:protein SCO1/2
MLAYGRDRGIADPDWHFASADAATIRRMTDDMGFTWSESPRGFDHITQVTVLDGAGRVVQQVYGQEFAPPELVEPLKQLLLGRAVERTSVSGLIERCASLLLGGTTPATGRYRFDLAMFAGVLPAFMVLGIIAMAVVVVGRKSR